VARGLITPDEAFDSVEAYSPAEEQFNRRRRTAGLVLGLVAARLERFAVGIAGHRHLATHCVGD